MAGDSDIAFAVGSSSTIVCYGLAYLIFKKLVGDKYGKGKEKQSGIYFWCGFIGLVAIGQGLGTVVNEVLFSLLAGVSARKEIVERGIFTLFAFPAIAALSAVFIAKISPGKPKDTPQKLEDEDNKNILENSFNSKNIILLFTVIIVIIGYNFIFPSLFKNVTERTVYLKNCISCIEKKCDAAAGQFTELKVTQNEVYIFLKTAEGQDRIVKYPDDPKMKCSIIPDRNFAFDCSLLETGSGVMSNKTAIFNGKDKVVFSSLMKKMGSELPLFDISTSCEAK
jgi:hypothetical protein